MSQRRLLEVEVELDLVHGRDDVRLVEEPLQVRHLEVGDPDGVDPPVRVELLERAPGVHVAVLRGLGPVDQVEVDVVQAQPPQARLERVEGTFVPLVVVPQLGRDEQILAGNPAGRERLADPRLVPVQRGGVDAAVAALDRGAHGAHRRLVRDPEDPVPQLRNPHPVVQSDVGYRRCHADQPPFVLQHRDGLDLDQPFRPAERGDADLGGGRRLLPDELLTDRDQLLAVPDVGEEGR